MHIGQRIKERRKELAMSVDDLAERLNKNRATIYRYEKGDIENLPLNILEPLAIALDTTPQYLLGWGEKHKKPNTNIEINNDLTIDDVIKALRIHNNLTQEECCNEIGIPLKDLQMYEEGSKQMSGSTITSVTRFFGADPADITGRLLYTQENDIVQFTFQKHYIEQLKNWNKEFGYNSFTQEEIDLFFEYARFLKWKHNRNT